MARVRGGARGISVIKVGEWDKAFGILNGMSSHPLMQELLERAMHAEAQYAREKLVKGIRDGAPGGKKFKGHAASTMITRKFGGRRGAKGTGKPLISSGSLVRGINVRRVKGEGSFVGILRTQRGADGANLVNLMQLHEGGKTIAIKVTEQMRRFLMAMFRSGGIAGAGAGKGGIVRGVIIVRIPARPVFGPVFRAHFSKAKVKARVVAFVRGHMLGAAVAGFGRAAARF